MPSVTAEKKASFLKAIDRCRKEDFDGHLDWPALSLERKLWWLARSARFVLAHQKVRSALTDASRESRVPPVR